MGCDRLGAVCCDGGWRSAAVCGTAGGVRLRRLRAPRSGAGRTGPVAERGAVDPVLRQLPGRTGDLSVRHLRRPCPAALLAHFQYLDRDHRVAGLSLPGNHLLPGGGAHSDAQFPGLAATGRNPHFCVGGAVAFADLSLPRWTLCAALGDLAGVAGDRRGRDRHSIAALGQAGGVCQHVGDRSCSRGRDIWRRRPGATLSQDINAHTASTDEVDHVRAALHVRHDGILDDFRGDVPVAARPPASCALFQRADPGHLHQRVSTGCRLFHFALPAVGHRPDHPADAGLRHADVAAGAGLFWQHYAAKQPVLIDYRPAVRAGHRCLHAADRRAVHAVAPPAAELDRPALLSQEVQCPAGAGAVCCDRTRRN